MELIQEINNLLPVYKTTLPFSKKDVTFTPFRIKDVKNLGIILQEQNKLLAFNAMLDILKRNCSSTNILELHLADAEYLFLQIRSKSVDEMLNLVYNKNKIQVNINDIQTKNYLQEENIDIGNNIKLSLKTPIIKDLIKLKSFEKEDLIKASVKSITVKNELYDCGKFVPEELKEILNNLPMNVSLKLDNFLKNEPQLFLHLNIENETKEVTGILNFFSYR
jgi:hypothetical protein